MRTSQIAETSTVENKGLGTTLRKQNLGPIKAHASLPKHVRPCDLPWPVDTNRYDANTVLKNACALLLTHSCPLPSSGACAWVSLMLKSMEQNGAAPVIPTEFIPDQLTASQPLQHVSNKFLHILYYLKPLSFGVFSSTTRFWNK